MDPQSLWIFVILAVVFVPLELLTQARPQQVFRPGWLTDCAHYFANQFLTQLGLGITLTALAGWLGPVVSPELRRWVYSQPFWVQLPLMMIVAEIAYYSAHRLAHAIPWLWHFHSVHHGSAQMDWLSTSRFHPLDTIFHWTLTSLPLYLLGFDPRVYALFLLIWLGQNVFAHANTRLRLPLLRHLLITPEFHRWHHSRDPAHYQHNFAGQLLFMDQLFRTYFLPRNGAPEASGTQAFQSSNHYLGHLLLPFWRIGKSIGGAWRTAPWNSRDRKLQ